MRDAAVVADVRPARGEEGGGLREVEAAEPGGPRGFGKPPLLRLPVEEQRLEAAPGRPGREGLEPLPRPVLGGRPAPAVDGDRAGPVEPPLREAFGRPSAQRLRDAAFRRIRRRQTRGGDLPLDMHPHRHARLLPGERFDRHETGRPRLPRQPLRPRRPARPERGDQRVRPVRQPAVRGVEIPRLVAEARGGEKAGVAGGAEVDDPGAGKRAPDGLPEGPAGQKIPEAPEADDEDRPRIGRHSGRCLARRRERRRRDDRLRPPTAARRARGSGSARRYRRWSRSPRPCRRSGRRRSRG